MNPKKTISEKAVWVNADQFRPVKLTHAKVKGSNIDAQVLRERKRYAHLTRSLVK